MSSAAGAALRSLLGLTPKASARDVRKAWKQRARKLHPDKETGNHEAFVALQIAWEAWKSEGDMPSNDMSPTRDVHRSQKRQRTASQPNTSSCPHTNDERQRETGLSHEEVQEILRKHAAKVRAAKTKNKGRGGGGEQALTRGRYIRRARE